MEDTPEYKVERKPKTWYQRLWNWVLILFLEEYELTVWYVYETVFDENGNRAHKRSRRTYQLKRITKKTNTHIQGVDVNGMPFEIKTVEPFDYELRKIK